MYYFIALNNRSGPLADVNVRKALAHLVDVEDYIENVDGGLGVRTVGHFHPARSYYNDALEPVAYNPEHAKSLLAQAGWQDSDADGRIDKIIDGKKTNLELELLMTGSNLSRNMALLLQESLGSVGIGMEIISKRSSVMRKENLENFNYDMAMLAVGQDAAPDDPYARWHSKAGGNNVSGYSNPAADSLIEQIRQSTDVNVRNQYYKALQKVMYEDQPVIFLYCPLKKIVINKRLDAVTTPKRPGYLANTFTAAE